jgi:hypothetical protein
MMGEAFFEGEKEFPFCGENEEKREGEEAIQ